MSTVASVRAADDVWADEADGGEAAELAAEGVEPGAELAETGEELFELAPEPGDPAFKSSKVAGGVSGMEVETASGCVSLSDRLLFTTDGSG